jgi:hypothetical protein
VDDFAQEDDGCSSRSRTTERVRERTQEAETRGGPLEGAAKESRDEMKGEGMSTDNYSVKMNE